MEIKITPRTICTVIDDLGRVSTLIGKDIYDFKKSPRVLLEPVRQACFILSRYAYFSRGHVMVEDLMAETLLVTKTNVKPCHVLLAIEMLAPKFYRLAEQGKPLPLWLKKKELPPVINGCLESYYKIKEDTKQKKQLGFTLTRIENGYHPNKNKNVRFIKKSNKRNSISSIKSGNSSLVGTNSKKCHLICKSTIK
jgi:hypothetical protein